MFGTELPSGIQKLLRYIDSKRPTGQLIWHDWHIEKIDGGANNLVYRVKRGGDDFAVKFTIKDARNRARREFVALHGLAEAGLEIAPSALWLDEVIFSQPVVVQSWLAGQVLQSPPENKADWHSLLSHYGAIHSLKKGESNSKIKNALLSFQNGQQGKAFVLQSVAVLPKDARPSILSELLQWFEAWEPDFFPEPTLSLCRVDANWRNFIRQENQWRSVDWENSGWGDAAFEIADLMTHPAYMDVDSADWPFVVEAYANLTHDPSCIMRINIYKIEMQMWWLIRWARYLYEVPRGLDERLSKRPDNWKPEVERKMAIYVNNFQTYIADV